jgi:outer membrane protein insertion porin family
MGRKAAAILILTAVVRASVGAAPGPPAVPVVASVEVRVDGRPADPDIGALIPIRPGEAFSLKRISNAVKQVYLSGLFTDVQVLKTGTDRIVLTFLLERKIIVGRISIGGDERIPRKKILDRLEALKPGGEFNEDKSGRAVEEIRAALENEGFFAPDVRLSTERDPSTNTADVRFEVRSARRYTIRRIDFVPTELLVRDERLKEKMKSRVGEDFVPSRLAADLDRIKAFYVRRGYQRAEVAVDSRVFDPQSLQVHLTLRVALNERIEIVVKGVKLPAGLLKPIWEERVFEEWGLSEGEARIMTYLRKKGYLFATVRSSIQREGTLLRIIHEVTPGLRFRVTRLSFVGASYFGEKGLKRELGLSEPLSLFGIIDGNRLFSLPREIELLYQTQGFPQAKVAFDLIREGTKVQAVFKINEGAQQRVESLSVVGALLFSEETLLATVRSRRGGPYFAANVQRDVEEMETFYLDQGIRGTTVAARVEETAPNAFSLRFEVDEGQQVRIGRILVSGIRVTRRRTIQRELRIHEGEPARYRSIQETKRRLENLGIFSEVKLEEVPSGPGLENLVISVREGELNYAGLGVGLETKNEPKTFAVWDNVIRPRGTAEYIRTNVFGTGAQLSLVAQFSLKEKRAVASWEQPYLFGLPLESYLNAWVEREEMTSYGFERRGVSLTSIKPLSREFALLGTLRWDRTILYFLDVSESEVDREHVPYSTTALSPSFIWDRRDDSANPTRGMFLSGAVEWAYPLLGAESDYLKFFIKCQKFLPVLSDVGFCLTGRLGLGMGKMPIHERFFGGGSNSFRGREFEGLGPRDPASGLPLGGKALLLLNGEFRFPLFTSLPDLSGAIFLDAGNVWNNRKEFNLFGLERALGFGLRYRTPLGPVRFDLAWNLDAPERKGKPLAFITIGNVF